MMTEWASRSAGNFWHDFVHQYANSIPAVRHLAVAVASQHTCLAGPESEQAHFTSNQYVKGLSLLSEAKETAGADTMLLCCSLICIYEQFDPQTGSSSSLTHELAALRICHDPATVWTRATWMFYSMFQRVETLMSVFKNPVILPGKEPGDLVDQKPILPQYFQTPMEMHGKLYEIIRWRFVYSYYHKEWSRHCLGFLQLLSMMGCWYKLFCEYASSMDTHGENFQPAMVLKTQFRVFYAGLWCSVDESSKHQQPELANLVALSDDHKVTVLVPVRAEPQPLDEDWQPQAHPHNSRRSWPEMEMISSTRQPVYVRLTLHAS